MGDVNCLWRLRILIGLPFSVGGLRLAKRARMETNKSARSNSPVNIERNKSGARGMRDRIRAREPGDS